MKVTIATLSDTVFTLEVASDMEVEHFKAFWFLAVEIGIGYISWSQVENFKALCEVESGIPAAEMVLLFNGQVVPCLESWWWTTIGGGGALLGIFSSPADAWGQEEFGGDWGWGWRHGDAGQAIIIELVLLLPFLVLGIFFYFKTASSSTKDWDKNRISKFSCRRSSAGGRRDVWLQPDSDSCKSFGRFDTPARMAPDSCASGGSGSAGSSTAPPARARLGEEDPATIRLWLNFSLLYSRL